MQCACASLSSVACPARQYFFTLPHKRHYFPTQKKNWTKNVCFDFLYNFCVEHFSFSEELSEIWSKMFIGVRVKYPLFLSDFNENPSNGSRIVPRGQIDGRTDWNVEAKNRLSNFANAPRKLSMSAYSLGWLFNGTKYPPLASWVLRNSYKIKGSSDLE